MIPQRMLGNDISHGGVRNRVTACRRRLRESRVMVKACTVTDVAELISVDAPSLCRITELAAKDEMEPAQSEVGIT